MAPANPFGPNVHIFDDSMTAIQTTINEIFPPGNNGIETDQFGSGRHAYLFMPGSYNLDLQVGYYTTVHGLGKNSPDNVTITGGVERRATQSNGVALNNFWCGAENLAVSVNTINNNNNPNKNMWAVSQATYLRRFHVKAGGELWLFDFTSGTNESSGGFIADSKVEGVVESGSQQQFLTRNTQMTTWDGGVWNMVFVGDVIETLTPQGSWPITPQTIVDATPVVREKPYLVFDDSTGDFALQVPKLKTGSQGISWSTPDTNPLLPISSFYIANAADDNAASLNNALQNGRNLILTPGVYHLAASLEVVRPNTVVFGLGMATLIPDQGTAALTIADVDGVSICGMIIDAGANKPPNESSSLLVVGPEGSNGNHSGNPTALFDVSCRVGGAAVGLTQNCVTVNSNNVILDNIWLWRADHGKDPSGDDVGWTINPATNGLTVNGNNVTAYGLFVEHFQGIQTLWNGENGSVLFYQSEIPYDVPSQAAWQQQNGEKGFPSYKVSDSVACHNAQGLGVYCFFRDAENVALNNAIETPTGSGIKMHHMVTKWLDGKPGTSINNIINCTGRIVANSVAFSPN